jgi:hypothetical protein
MTAVAAVMATAGAPGSWIAIVSGIPATTSASDARTALFGPGTAPDHSR